MSKQGGFSNTRPSIVTRAELDELLSARETAKPELHLRPDGAMQTEVHKLQREEIEDRLKHVQERLQLVHDVALNEHAIAGVRERAKKDFGRSR